MAVADLASAVSLTLVAETICAPGDDRHGRTGEGGHAHAGEHDRRRHP